MIARDADGRVQVGNAGGNVTRGGSPIFPASLASRIETIDGHEFLGMDLFGAESMKGTWIKVMARYDASAQEYVVLLDSTVPVTIVCDPENPEAPEQSSQQNTRQERERFE